MTSNPLSEPTLANNRSRWAIALIAAFAIATFWLTHPVTRGQSLSPVAGLITLKASAQSATPYDTAIANGKPTLIEFYADWCTTCQSLAPTLAAVHKQYDNSVNFVMMNIDDPRWREQIRQFQVTGVPKLVLRDAQGAIADTFVGKVPKLVLLQSIEQML